MMIILFLISVVYLIWFHWFYYNRIYVTHYIHNFSEIFAIMFAAWIYIVYVTMGIAMAVSFII